MINYEFQEEPTISSNWNPNLIQNFRTQPMVNRKCRKKIQFLVFGILNSFFVTNISQLTMWHTKLDWNGVKISEIIRPIKHYTLRAIKKADFCLFISIKFPSEASYWCKMCLCVCLRFCMYLLFFPTNKPCTKWALNVSEWMFFFHV